MATYSVPLSRILSGEALRLSPLGLDLRQALENPTGFAISVIKTFLWNPENDIRFAELFPGTVAGGPGNDLLIGGAGNDTLHGGAGSNLLFGGDGDDVLDVRWSTDPDRGGVSYADWSEAKRGATDWLFGGAGHDALWGSFGSDLLDGGTGNDTLYGQDGDDLLYGEDGDDLLLGGAGNDTLHGDAGRDTLSGGLGDDRLYGGDGNDRLSGDNGHDLLDGGAGNDTIRGGYGDDSITAGDGNDWVDGGAGDDLIDLGAGNDFVAAVEEYGRGDDSIFGRAGNDTLHGGRGSDLLDGGEGDDVLNGGAGDDFLIGGAGSDLFQFRSAHGVDTIADFSVEDQLVITRNINGQAIDPADLGDRIQDLGDSALLDLGNGHGVIFLGHDADSLGELLQGRVDFF